MKKKHNEKDKERGAERNLLLYTLSICYLVLAEPHNGLFKLLQEPSSERYGDLIQRFGGMAQRGPPLFCFGYDAPPIKLLKRMELQR